MDIIIGIGEMATTNVLSNTIKTFALGSCVAMTLYDRKNKIAGMVHIALPFGEKKQSRPCYYASNGIYDLFHEMMTAHNCILEDLEIELFGGAHSFLEEDMFNIGQRNLDYVIKLLKYNNLKFKAHEIGGTVSRTVYLSTENGNKVLIEQPLLKINNLKTQQN